MVQTKEQYGFIYQAIMSIVREVLLKEQKDSTETSKRMCPLRDLTSYRESDCSTAQRPTNPFDIGYENNVLTARRDEDDGAMSELFANLFRANESNEPEVGSSKPAFNGCSHIHDAGERR